MINGSPVVHRGAIVHRLSAFLQGGFGTLHVTKRWSYERYPTQMDNLLETTPETPILRFGSTVRERIANPFDEIRNQLQTMAVYVCL